MAEKLTFDLHFVEPAHLSTDFWVYYQGTLGVQARDRKSAFELFANKGLVCFPFRMIVSPNRLLRSGLPSILPSLERDFGIDGLVKRVMNDTAPKNLAHGWLQKMYRDFKSSPSQEILETLRLYVPGQERAKEDEKDKLLAHIKSNPTVAYFSSFAYELLRGHPVVDGKLHVDCKIPAILNPAKNAADLDAVDRIISQAFAEPSIEAGIEVMPRISTQVGYSPHDRESLSRWLEKQPSPEKVHKDALDLLKYLSRRHNLVVYEPKLSALFGKHKVTHTLCED